MVVEMDGDMCQTCLCDGTGGGGGGEIGKCGFPGGKKKDTPGSCIVHLQERARVCWGYLGNFFYQGFLGLWCWFLCGEWFYMDPGEFGTTTDSSRGPLFPSLSAHQPKNLHLGFRGRKTLEVWPNSSTT